MAITSLTGVQTAVKQSFALMKVSGAGSLTNPFLRLFGGSTIPRVLTATTISNPSNATGGIQFTNPSPGMDTYVSDVNLIPTGLPPYYYILIDVVFAYTLSNVTTLQTLAAQSMGARDINGTTRGDGVYLLLTLGDSNLASGSSILTATYTSSDGNIGRTAVTPTFSNLAGGSIRFLNIQNGDVGVRSVQSVQFSAAPGGTTYLVAYRPIALVVGSSDLRSGAAGDSISLGLPRVYDNSCIHIIFGGSLGYTGPISFIQG